MNRVRRYGFIGAGNMAQALITGLLKEGGVPPETLIASDKDPGQRARVFAAWGIAVADGNGEVVREAEVLLLCTKPQDLRRVMAEIGPLVTPDQLLISILAGVTTRQIGELAGRPLPVVRAMPNTPGLVQQGITALAPGVYARSGDLETAQDIFSTLGETVVVREDLMDAVTAVSGSGPGYVFRILQGLLAASLTLGLTEDTARRLLVQTFLGAAHLAKESGKSLEALKSMVTSPGGTTAAGLEVLDQGDIDGLLRDVLQAAHRRARELGGG